MTSTVQYFAHSAPESGGFEPLAEHLELVAQRARRYADSFGAGPEAYLAGLLHDAGKASPLFTRRLSNQASGLDHWSPGAAAALRIYRQQGIAAALAIQGHHVGLGSAAESALRDLGQPKIPADRTLTIEDPACIPDRLASQGIELPPEVESSYSPWSATADGMLQIRMLFSALVDADFLETEAHFTRDAAGDRTYRPTAATLRPAAAFELLAGEVERLTEHYRDRSSPEVQGLRTDLYRACREGAEHPPGLFTLTAPTGSGKTLSMLAFALRHAERHGLRRVVMAVPYLSILEQTAQVYRNLLEPRFGTGYVLEHHSLAGTRGGAPPGNEKEPDEVLRQRQAENWDAPLVITTSVQLLESLFANRPRACRKLHRLARSVMLFDEVQTLPPALTVATLATLGHLARRFGASVVFSTATQPAFEQLDSKVRQWSAAGWEPRELVPRHLELFRRVERVRVEPRVGDFSPAHRLPWEELAAELAELPQVLCILNLKRHAHDVATRLQRRGVEGVRHLSTAQCPAHRQAILARVREDLAAGKPCRLVSTQCVEAGVDLDFPDVYRAFAPLDALAQAAGRCNRNGVRTEPGRLVVFLPEAAEENAYPSKEYRLAAAVAREILQTRATDGWDLQDSELFDAWYRKLYDVAKIGEDQRTEERRLHKALQARNLEDVAREYRLIKDDTVQVVVPWDRKRYAALEASSRTKPWVYRDWMREAQVHAVSLFRSQCPDYRNALIPAPRGAPPEQRSEDWYFLAEHDLYGELGLEQPADLLEL